MEEVTHKVAFSIKNSDLLVQPLAFKSIAFIEELVNLLQADYNSLEDSQSSRITFIWSYQVKDIALLLRDSIVNLLKLEQLHKDGLKSEDDIHAYQQQLSEIIETAVHEVQRSYENCEANNHETKDEWNHQVNPTPIIVEQVETLIDHIKTIQRSQHKLDKLHTKFDDYRTSYLEHMERRKLNGENIYKELKKLKESIEKEDDTIEKSQLTKIDNQILHAIEQLENKIDFPPYQYIVLEDTDKLKLAVGSQGGQLVYKSIDILSEVSGWSSFNLTSALKNIDTTLQTYKGRVLVGLIQMSNRIKAKFESGQEGEITLQKSLLLAPLSKMIAEYNDEILPKELKKLDELEELISSHIRGSQLFNEQYTFLPSSAIGQLTGFAEKSELQRRYNPTRIKKEISGYTERFFSDYSKNEHITAAKYIDNLLNFDSESDVNALFLKNGFLGSSFSIDRPEIMYQIDNHFKLWQKGFGGALLIAGNHLSGRSTILEMLPITYPETISYHIVPGQKIDVNGYKTIMTDDLLKTLEFIIKYKGASKVMVTIDDLTYYVTNPEETFDLFTRMNRFILKYSKQIYFAVVVHSFLHKKLSHFFNIGNTFTEVVVTDSTPIAEIERAVLTRAHAIANNDDIQSDVDTITSTSRKVARKSNENIGRAMLLWCMFKDEEFDQNLSNNKFKELIKDHAPLLKTIILHGTISHTQLNNMLNDFDARQLKYDIEGLIQIKLLHRPKEGCIDINPYLKTFVEPLLA